MIVELCAVGQAGQHVMQRQKANAFFCRAALRQITDDDQPLWLIVPLKIAHAVFDGQHATVFVNGKAVVGGFHTGGDYLFDLCMATFGHKLQRLMAHHFVHGVAEHFQQRWIDVGDRALHVKCHAFNARVHELAQSRRDLKALKLCQTVWRDVKHHHKHPISDGLTARHQTHLNPARMLFGQVSRSGVAHGCLQGDHAGKLRNDPLSCIRANDLLNCLAQHLVAGHAAQCCVRRIGINALQ